MGTIRSRHAAALATCLPLGMFGGCISGPQLRDFVITEALRVVADVAGQVFGSLISTGLAT